MGVAYAILLFIVYVLTFPARKAVFLSGYVWYTVLFVLSAWLTVFYLYFSSKIWKKYKNIYILMVSLLAAALVGWQNQEISGVVSGYFKEDMKRITYIEDISHRISAVVPKGKKLYVIEGDEPPAMWAAIRFYRYPEVVHTGGRRLMGTGGALYWKTSKRELLEDIKLHDYIYFVSVSKKFIEKYAVIFEDTSLLKEWMLYRIDSTTDGMLRLTVPYEIKPDTSIDTFAASLEEAVVNGHIEMAQLLLDRDGVDINASDSKNGATVLMHATWLGREDMVNLLTARNADVNAANNDGGTALMNAAVRGYENITRILIENGADMELADKNGSTALMHAAWHGHFRIVKLLLERGANINASDPAGNTALKFARARGHADIAELLAASGAGE